MKLTFTLNDMESYALATARWSEYYDFYRLDTGIPVGVFCPPQIAYEAIRKNYLVYKDEWQSEFISIGRKVFELELVDHGYRVEIAMQELKIALQSLHCGSVSASFVAKAKKKLVALLQVIEW
jgi:hypothetical protein